MKRYRVKFENAIKNRNIYIVYVSAENATHAYDKAYKFLYNAYGKIICYCYYCISVERDFEWKNFYEVE